MVSWRSRLFCGTNLRRLLIIGGGGTAVTAALSLLQTNLNGSTRLRTVLVDCLKLKFTQFVASTLLSIFLTKINIFLTHNGGWINL